MSNNSNSGCGYAVLLVLLLGVFFKACEWAKGCSSALNDIPNGLVTTNEPQQAPVKEGINPDYPILLSSNKYTKHEHKNIGGYPCVVFGNDIAWMKNNLNIELGTSVLTTHCLLQINGVAQKHDNGRLKTVNTFDTRFYKYEDAVKACSSIGWRLPTKEDVRLLFNYSSFGEEFNEIRAFGSLRPKGEIDLLNFGGIYNPSIANTQPKAARITVGRYGAWWTTSLSSDYARQLLIIDKEVADVALLAFEEEGYQYTCRCVKDIE